MKGIVAIIEGVELSLLRQHLDQLPWFRQYVDKKPHHFDLDCGPVPYEPSHLATAFTGMPPGHHGCFSYWEVHDYLNSKPRVIESFDVKLPRIWEWQESQHLKWGVVNVQLTHPPRPMNGLMYTYLMQQTLKASYPYNLQAEWSKKGIRFAHDVSAFYRGEEADTFASKVFDIAEYQFQTGLAMSEHVDVMVINLTIADRLSHFLWSELNDPGLDRQPHILQAYQYLDRTLAQLSTLLDQEGFLMAFTEIGFGPIKYFTSIDDHLCKAGLQKRLANGQIDYKNSLACEAVQGSHGINLLPFWKDSNMISKQGEPYERAVKEVSDALRQFKHTDDNSAVIAKTYPGRNLYPGPWSHLAPDIVIQPADLERPPQGDPRWANHVNRHLQTGWHRDQGFGLLLGNNKLDNIGKHIKSLTDIAPRLCELLNIDIPAHTTLS